MALRGLQAVTPELPTEDYINRAGFYMYDGSAWAYDDWEFRTKLKVKTTKVEDQPHLISKIVDALYGDAQTVAQDLGVDKLAGKTAVEDLVEALRNAAFP